MTQEERLVIARRFTENICEWYTPRDDEKSQDKARLAILRRNAGESLDTQRQANWFHGFAPAFKPYSTDALFLVATLIAFDRPYLKRERIFVGNLGKTFHVLWKSQAGPKPKDDDKPKSTVARRFGILLESDYDNHLSGELPFRLRQTVRWIIGQNENQIGIDWPKLLDDVQRMAWKVEDEKAKKAVQKEWAKEFYIPMRDSQPLTETETETQGETDAD